MSSPSVFEELPVGWPARLRPDRLAALAFQTPYLAADVTVIADKFVEFRSGLPGVEPYYYAVKASLAPEVISTLAGLDAGFRAGSFSELRLLLEHGVEGSRVLFGNTVAPGPQLRSAAAAGVWRLAFDSESQLQRIAEFASTACVYLHLRMDDEAGLRPLGADASEARHLMTMARDLGLVPYGLSLQSGTRHPSVSAWRPALAKVGQVMSDLLEDGIGLAMLNLGDGIPVPQAHNPQPLADFGPQIRAAMNDLLPYQPDNLVCEPGRALVEESAVLVTTVLDRSRRDGVDWLVLDAGVQQNLAEGAAHQLATTVPDLGSNGLFNLAGPSPDPGDVIAYGVSLPDAIAPGDLVMFGASGAHLSQTTGPRTLFV